MDQENLLITTLQRQFLLRQQTLPKYSLRKYAIDLKIAVSTLSEILAGKRLPSGSMAKRLIGGLALDSETTRALNRCAHDLAKNTAEERKVRRMKFAEMEEPTLSLIAEWHHFSILSLIKTHNFNEDPQWIALRLRITPEKAQASMELLAQLGLIRKSRRRKKWVRTNKHITTSDDVANKLVQSMQRDSLRLARRSLRRDKVEIRDFVSISLAGDPKRMPQAKVMTRRFVEKLCAFLEGGEKSEVYRISVNTFPVSKVR